jgi:hypothetical protein
MLLTVRSAGLWRTVEVGRAVGDPLTARDVIAELAQVIA